MKIMAAAGAADDGFRKEHGGTGNVGAAVTMIEMLAMSDLSLMVKAGVQWGLFGGAAQTATIAAVFAQLITTRDGEQVNHGVHCFLVPIRDAEGNDLPGATTSDCQYKGGLPGVDNGRIVFDHVRVPRVNLLNKYGDVAADGSYSSPIENPNRRSFTMIGTLIRGRICVGGGAGNAARVALDIATRYALQRKQFSAPDEHSANGEVLIMDYLVHQRRLFPLIARSYALQFAQNELVARCHDLQTADVPDAEGQRELESRAAGLKAANTWHATRAIQEAREACGGAGYMADNRLIALRADIDVFTTFEGDNHVLTQLVAKELLTAYADDVKSMSPVEWVRFAANFAGERVLKRDNSRRQTGQRRRRQPVQPRHPSHDVRGPRGIPDRLGGAPVTEQIERDVVIRCVQRRTGSCASCRAPTSIGWCWKRSSPGSSRVRTTPPARCSGICRADLLIRDRAACYQFASVPIGYRAMPIPVRQHGQS